MISLFFIIEIRFSLVRELGEFQNFDLFKICRIMLAWSRLTPITEIREPYDLDSKQLIQDARARVRVNTITCVDNVGL